MTPDINKILRAHPVPHSNWGSPMGAADEKPDDGDELYLQRIRFVDGDYAPDGTYWGRGPEPLWAAFKPDLSALIYVRAWGRDGAARKVLETYPEVKIKRYRRLAREYMGWVIFPCSHVYGWRWEARTSRGQVFSETLAGVKELIRENEK